MKEAGFAELCALIGAVQRTVAAPFDSPDSARGVELAQDKPARLYLVSRTSHLAEGWCDRVPELELAGDAHLRQGYGGQAGGADLGDAVREAGRALGVGVVWESPVDVIPLPAGWEERSLGAEALAEAARPAMVEQSGAGNALDLRHFDPYSVVLRLIARGDEPDYVAALEYVHHGWVEPARLESLLSEVVPRMTNQTLAQDPAEFRRKFKGLRQLYLRSHSVYSPGGTRAGEAVSSA
jgi:hypothetical protein